MKRLRLNRRYKFTAINDEIMYQWYNKMDYYTMIGAFKIGEEFLLELSVEIDFTLE